MSDGSDPSREANGQRRPLRNGLIVRLVAHEAPRARAKQYGAGQWPLGRVKATSRPAPTIGAVYLRWPMGGSHCSLSTAWLGGEAHARSRAGAIKTGRNIY